MTRWLPRWDRVAGKTRLSVLRLQSIQLRVLLLVLILVLAATILLTRYTLDKFEESTRIELEHEGLLLSNALEASIAPLAQAVNIPAMHMMAEV